MVNVGFIQSSVKYFKNWIVVFESGGWFSLIHGKPNTKIIPKFYKGMLQVSDSVDPAVHIRYDCFFNFGTVNSTGQSKQDVPELEVLEW